MRREGRLGVGRGRSVNSYQVIQFRIRGKEGFLCSDLNVRKGRKGGKIIIKIIWNMEAEKADVIISCFITLSGPLCNLPCKPWLQDLVHQPNTWASESNTLKNTYGASLAEPVPTPGSRAVKLPARHKTTPLYPFFKGGVVMPRFPDIFFFFFFRFCFG